MVRIVHDGPPVLPSTVDPSKRRPNYKEPTPPEKWSPRWKPRKREPGTTKEDRALLRQAAEDAMLGHVEFPTDLPRDPRTGKLVSSDGMLDALCNYLSQGGTLLRFSQKVGVPRTTLNKWVDRDAKWKSAVAQARSQGADAMAEEALSMATDPLIVEDVYERYDNDGNLMSRDVKRGDSVHARKLAVSTRLELLRKWSPEKYGDSVTAKTDDAMAAKILAARRRLASS